MVKAAISLERYTKCVRAVFDTLSASDDGMTAYDIAKITGYPRSTVNIVVEDNLLFYVDRWKRSRVGVPTRIFMASKIERFEDCPRPDDMKI
jgi:DNA-binding transcriptional regulator GbsR (MarR family)